MALATVGRYLLLVAFLVVVLSIGLVMVFVLMWRYRYVLEQKLINILTPILLHINHLSTRITTPSPASLEQRIEEFFVALERIATDRSKLLRAIGLSAFGWLIQMLLLWLTFFALGQTISLSVLLFIVPIANIADIVPVPGGLGAIDTMYVVLFVSITPVNATVSTAAVLLFRTIIYGLPTIVGGCSTVFFGTQVFSTGMERY